MHMLVKRYKWSDVPHHSEAAAAKWMQDRCGHCCCEVAVEPRLPPLSNGFAPAGLLRKKQR